MMVFGRLGIAEDFGQITELFELRGRGLHAALLSLPA